MISQDPAVLQQLLEQLRLEHRDLDEVVDRLVGERSVDELHLKRMKKRKLRIKDEISRLESMLIPDLDA